MCFQEQNVCWRLFGSGRFVAPPLLERKRRATTTNVRNFWRFVALAPLACACGSGSAGSDSATPTTASGTHTASITLTHTATTSGGVSATTASATSGASTMTVATSAGMPATSAGGSGSGGGAGGADAGDTGSTSSSTSGPQGPTGTPVEEDRSELPTVRQEHGAAALNGEVYVLGGFTPDASSSVQAYDPENDSWRDVADFPAVFHHPNVAVVGGTIYVAGFHLGSSLGDADGRVFAYDPAADAWVPRTSMPVGTERGASCVATLDDDIYVFGGASDVTLPDASVYDTVADEWTPLPPMPALREHCVAAGIDGKIYIVSGRANNIQGIQVESWVYDPAGQTYDERSAMPTPRAGAAGATLSGRIFVFGGEGNPDDPDGIFHDIEVFDPATNSWEELPDMTIPRHGYAAAAVGDRIYLPGGATAERFGATNFHTVFFFDPAN